MKKGVSKTPGDASLNLGMNYANLGVSYKELGELDTALVYYQKSRDLAQKLNIPQRLAQNYLNIGNIHKSRGEYDVAEESMRNALRICRENNFTYGKLVTLVNLGDNFYERGDYRQAKALYDTSLALSHAYDLPVEEYKIYHALFDLENTRKNYPEAIQNLRRYYALKDSLEDERMEQRVQELQIQYETEKTAKENALLKQEKEALTKRFKGFSPFLD